jgi:hypothetical protein
VNLIHNGPTIAHDSPEEDDCYGKVLLKGKLIPRKRRMRRKSKTQLQAQTMPSSMSSLSTSTVASSTFLFAPPTTQSFRKGVSFDTADSAEKIPIVLSVGSIDFDAGQFLLFGEVRNLSSPISG